MGENSDNKIVSHATIVISEVESGRFVMRSSGCGNADEMAMDIMKLIAAAFEDNEHFQVTLEDAHP